MRSDRVISTIDFHTAGIGMRLLTSGLGKLPGTTIGEKRRFFQEHHEDLRTGLCLEPRGHRSLLIAVMTDAVTPGAHFGLFFIYPGGYYVSCGEGTIGAATVAIETGMVRRLGAETPVIIDTEAGVVETVARADGDRVREVTLRWTPSFVVLAGQSVEVESLGEVPVDVAVGVGNVFAIVEAQALGVAVRRELARRIAQQGMAVRDAVNAQLEVSVPGLGKTSVDNVLVHELPDRAGVSPNALVWGPGQVDAAPCGSGTCARMALFHHRGLMRAGSSITSRGLLGLDFTGRIAGAIRDVGDSSGDSRLFVENLARVCREKLGVAVRLGTRVTALRGYADRIDAALTSDGEMRADNYVLALGVGAPSVARTVGVSLPVYPAKGYSSTFPLKPGGRAPLVPGVDEKWLVGWSRLGDRLRLTSTAEFAGYDWGWTPRDFNNILKLARDLFPDAADYDRGEYRACLRPMTPDGPPILGLGRHRNLFLNAGHGHMGWTMACGTARIVADLMTGRMPALDLEGLTVRR